MKLKKILKHIDFLADIEIHDSGAEEADWIGSVLKVPWDYAEMRLDTDINGEAISIKDNRLVIFVR